VLVSQGLPTEGIGNSSIYMMPCLSADGRYVAFESVASNLVAGDTNGMRDIFVHDRDTGVTERVSVASDGTEANFASGQPSISGTAAMLPSSPPPRTWWPGTRTLPMTFSSATVSPA